VVVLSSPAKRVAFRVDEVLNEQEVLVKNLGSQLSRVPNVAGAMILSSGTVVPILNVPDLMKSAVNASDPAGAAAAAGEANGRAAKPILVVEDSITARTLLKNILESAGYRVKVAVDGLDAITTLKTEEFAAVVSDIEMPRMDGFDLTDRIRHDQRLSQLPVVLVTALESREHKERGVDVGADAYIVKSSFDQTNLVETVQRLI
jgi:two-component system chemotaxis sensor kinase CheA